ncbi:unnamed protein product [Rotaria socialis]|uniref:alpha-1,2-Mannosidase n=2 Tax=Rotaria socialis TaxID=392032 RepID=A0A820RSN7_9BILA|nr:unnamed protein product [Rotaria socialis]CAF3414331.1 unnamed protein product [Rotaria socialis]CAF3500120.1 unnamed protein product [Rotaria socialis]CAF3655648.1 unnamed protein product [Rotaria socialis]CAF3755090.1 unnamed protein product [Rotaria socialis]
MAILIFISSLLLFVLTIAYHPDSATPINNLNITKISHEQRYQHYLYFPRSERLLYREKAREMFQFGYDNYMKYAFPKDELDPIHCRGRGPDVERPENYNINDVLGEFSLTLIDSLDTLAVMGNVSEFQHAVQLVIDHVRFDRNSTIQVFEATIRVLGALLSAHLLIIDPLQPFGDLKIPDYDNELLDLAHDLASRLLPAFERTPHGLPYPRVNLMTGMVDGSRNDTSTAGAGSLSLEFSILSRLVGDPVYERVARRAVNSLWAKRNNVTGLLGSVIDVNSGEWLGQLSGLGAGIDSFFEYLLKNYILFGDESDLRMFDDAYRSVTQYLRRGRVNCMDEEGIHPMFVNVNMQTGQLATTWIDALQASFPAVQVLRGDIDEAICLHALYYSIWRKFGVLPERFNWQIKMPDVLFYPLRPEFIESTYFLYQATKNPFYLHVGRDILDNLNTYTRAECGFATVHDVRDKTLEDRMESFFLSETCKYLFLLFDEDNYLNQHGANHYIFTTEAHIIPLMAKLRKKVWDSSEMAPCVENKEVFMDKHSYTNENELINVNRDLVKVEKTVISIKKKRINESSCRSRPISRRHQLPLSANLLYQLDEMVGVIIPQP